MRSGFSISRASDLLEGLAVDLLQHHAQQHRAHIARAPAQCPAAGAASPDAAAAGIPGACNFSMTRMSRDRQDSPGTERTCERSGMLSTSCEVLLTRCRSRTCLAAVGEVRIRLVRDTSPTSSLSVARPFDDGARQELPGEGLGDAADLVDSVLGRRLVAVEMRWCRSCRSGAGHPSKTPMVRPMPSLATSQSRPASRIATSAGGGSAACARFIPGHNDENNAMQRKVRRWTFM